MKRIALAFTAVLSIALFTGCDVVNGILRMAMGDALPFQSAAPVTTTTTAPLPSEPELSNAYTSSALGLSFTVPDRWVGKFRVEEGDGYLAVYFNPNATVDAAMGEGRFFTIVKKTADIDESCYDNAKAIDIDGVPYIWGEPTDVQYQQGEPEYDTYLAMQQDLPAIQATVCAAACVQPTITAAPGTNVYTSKLLGISFTLPDSWKGKCTVVEDYGMVSVYFKPKAPLTEDTGDGYLFMIEKKTARTTDDEGFMDNVQEVTVGGVTYICGGPTDVTYQGPEQKTFMAMNQDIPGIYASIRAAQ